MKKIFVIDWLMLGACVPSVCSGFGLHIAAHGATHAVWHAWAVFHVLSSLLFLAAMIFHVQTHWGWYKGLISRGIGGKSKVTLALSVVFAFVVVTGFILLGVEGAGSAVGLWHHRAGIVASVLSAGHIRRKWMFF